MRKSLVLTLLLLALSVSAVCLAHSRVNKARDAVTLDEMVLYGDKSAAEGITVDCRATSHNQLFWDTSYTVGTEPEIGTGYSFSQAQRRENATVSFDGVYFDVYSDFGMSSTGAIDMEEENLHGMSAVYRDLAGRTEAGKTHSEQVYLKDYFEFYPLYVSLYLPAYWADETTQYVSVQQAAGDSGQIQQKLADFFRIPVVKNHRVEAHVTKNAVGDVTGWGMSTLESGVSLWAISALTDGGCYFTFNNQTVDGGTVDTGYIPGGYGIYYLPYCMEDGNPIVSVDRLSMVFPIDPQAELVELCTDPGQSRLLLITMEHQTCMLTVIDIDTMNQLQKLELLDCSDGRGIQTVFQYDDFLVPVSGNNELTVVSVTETGAYELQFTAQISGPESESSPFYLRSDCVMDYDGRRLAIADFASEHKYRYDTCSFYLAVCDETGLTYYGEYANSLDAGDPEDLSYRCRPRDHEPLSVSWGN